MNRVVMPNKKTPQIGMRLTTMGIASSDVEVFWNTPKPALYKYNGNVIVKTDWGGDPSAVDDWDENEDSVALPGQNDKGETDTASYNMALVPNNYYVYVRVRIGRNGAWGQYGYMAMSPSQLIVVTPTSSTTHMYVAYASDINGSDFSLNYDSEIHQFVAIRTSQDVIENISADHFAGLWTRMGYVDPITPPIQWYTYVGYASTSNGANFSTTLNPSVHLYVATKSTPEIIPNLDASDFVGLWRLIATNEEEWDGGEW